VTILSPPSTRLAARWAREAIPWQQREMAEVVEAAWWVPSRETPMRPLSDVAAYLVAGMAQIERQRARRARSELGSMATAARCLLPGCLASR